MKIVYVMVLALAASTVCLLSMASQPTNATKIPLNFSPGPTTNQSVPAAPSTSNEVDLNDLILDPADLEPPLANPSTTNQSVPAAPSTSNEVDLNDLILDPADLK